MSELNYQILDVKGQEVGALELNPFVFGAPIHQESVHMVVRQQLAARRAGTHSVLGRSAMKGGGKKPFKQKGTGHARQGSNTSPLNPGGAIVFGPSPRDYSFKVTKGVRRKALASVLSDKVKKGSLRIVDELKVDAGKTRNMKSIFDSIGVTGRVLVVVNKDENCASDVFRAAHNLPFVVTLPPEGVNVYDIIKAQYLVGTKAAIKAIEARFQVKND